LVYLSQFFFVSVSFCVHVTNTSKKNHSKYCKGHKQFWPNCCSTFRLHLYNKPIRTKAYARESNILWRGISTLNHFCMTMLHLKCIYCFFSNDQSQLKISWTQLVNFLILNKFFPYTKLLIEPLRTYLSYQSLLPLTSNTNLILKFWGLGHY
jgi:hypothetical protein